MMRILWKHGNSPTSVCILPSFARQRKENLQALIGGGLRPIPASIGMDSSVPLGLVELENRRNPEGEEFLRGVACQLLALCSGGLVLAGHDHRQIGDQGKMIGGHERATTSVQR